MAAPHGKPNIARGIPPLRIHNFVGTALGAGMWFFVSRHRASTCIGAKLT
jgi:hypothetical protein